jgi:hypothetical protein
MGTITQGKKYQPSANDWISNTEYALDTTYAMSIQQLRDLLEEHMMIKSIILNRIVSAPRLDIAIGEIEIIVRMRFFRVFNPR